MSFRLKIFALALPMALPVFAQKAVTTTTATTTVTETRYDDGSVSVTVATDTVTANLMPVELPAAKPERNAPRDCDPFVCNGAMGHFTWGVDLGSAIDLTSHDMSIFELGASFGYKGGWFRFAGVGATIVSMINNSSRCYPIYGMVRTSFTPEHKLCFMELKAGVSINTINEFATQTDFYGSLGVGLTLAHSRKFSSHVILRGIFMPLHSVEIDGVRQLDYSLGYAAIGIGCAF